MTIVKVSYKDAPFQIKQCIEYFRKKIFDKIDKTSAAIQFEFIGTAGEPKNTQSIPTKNFWVAGGAVRDFFTQRSVETDIDLFFANRLDFSTVRNHWYWDDLDHLFPSVENDNVIKIITHQGKFDLVKKFFETPEKTVESFDFTVCAAAVDYDNFYYHPDFFMDLASKRLQIVSLPYPIATLARLQRYIKKGYTACNGTMLTLARGIQAVNLEDRNQNVLEYNPDGTERIIYFD